MIVNDLYPLSQKLAAVKLCIFDFDGTLVNLEQLNYDSAARVVMKHLLKKPDLDFYRENMAGYESIVGFKRAFEHYNPERAGKYDYAVIRDEFRNYKREAIISAPAEYAKVIVGAEEFLKALHSKGIPLSIASASSREFILNLLTHFDLLHYFRFIVSSEDVKVGKPSPEPYLMVLENHKIDSQYVVAFEDSRSGMRSAKSAGLYTVGIHNPGWNDEYVWEMADFTVSDYRECIRSLGGSS